FFSSRRRHTRFSRDWSSDVCSSDLETAQKLRMVFEAIRTTRGVYLFDEIDALAAARGTENDIGEARRVLNSFLQFLDEDTGPSKIGRASCRGRESVSVGGAASKKKV